MPTTVKKSSRGGYDIVEVRTGKKKGHASNRKDAEISSRIRNAGLKQRTK